jgi:hypothetical protein
MKTNIKTTKQPCTLSNTLINIRANRLSMLTTVAACCLGLSGPVLAATNAASNASTDALNYKEIAKELTLMKSVLDTALKQPANKGGIRYRALSVNYLANQGVVFEVSSTQSRSISLFGRHDQHMPVGPHTPPPPATPSIPDIINFKGMEEGIQQIEVIVENAMENVEMAFFEHRDELHQLREEERDIAWELRDAQRELRDLNFILRNADAQSKQEMTEEIKELEQKITEYTAKQAATEAQSQALLSERQTKLAQQHAQKEQAKKQFLAQFEMQVGDALCRFGSGLRAVPTDAYVNFVIKDMALDNDGHSSNQIYVFKMQDIKACVQEKMDVNGLLTAATVYQF